MTGPGNFVARWARLKRNSDRQRRTVLAGDPLPLPPADAAAGGGEATISKPRTDAAAEEWFDPATLPSIEAITVDTNIRGFLQSRVPAELTRAALRRAWVSDPAIRDFIGIAENQWDFNDPNAIPGFGPLLESDNVPGLLRRVLGQHDKFTGIRPEMPASVEPSLPAQTYHEPADLDRKPEQPLDSPPGSGGDGPTSNDRVAGQTLSPGRRSHGGALPRVSIEG